MKRTSNTNATKYSKAKNNNLRNGNLVKLLSFIVVCLFWIIVYQKVTINTVKTKTQKTTTIIQQQHEENQLDILNQAEEANGFRKDYPTYQLKGIDSMDKEEAEELADETEELEKLIEKNDAKQGIVENNNFLIDQEAYDNAPYIVVPKPKYMRQKLWWALKAYEKYYQAHPSKLYVPRINPNVNLTLDDFHNKFRRHGLPVIINFKSLRHLGYTTEPLSMKQLKELFPYIPENAEKALKEYKANGIRRSQEEIDLGPAIEAISQDGKMTKSGSLRNFPRNLKITKQAGKKLKLDYPPLLKRKLGESLSDNYQMATLWTGTSQIPTKNHHDASDNFVAMIHGTKRFTLSPTSDWRLLSPNCVGQHASLCWASVPHPDSDSLTAKQEKIMKQVSTLTIDLKAGEILYMPAGWFHHIQNLGPTVMINFWTRRSEQIGLIKALKQVANEL